MKTDSMMAKLLTSLMVLAVSSGGLLLAIHQDQDLKQDTTPFMERKLDRAREIVEGLATEDYDMISKSAQGLMLLSHETEWKVVKGETYAQMSAEFRESAKRLRDTANKENLDGSTLAYFEVTLNCVRCHKYIRGSVAGRVKPKLPGAAKGN